MSGGKQTVSDSGTSSVTAWATLLLFLEGSQQWSPHMGSLQFAFFIAPREDRVSGFKSVKFFFKKTGFVQEPKQKLAY
jgi:hypothetical protein